METRESSLNPDQVCCHSLSTLALAASLLLGGLAPAHSVDASDWLVNVDFFSGLAGTSPKTGPAATGQSTNDFWNFYSRTAPDGSWLTFGVLTNLTQANGSPTQAGLTVANAPGAWYSSSDDQMYRSYIYPYPTSTGNATLTVTNLPAGDYDFYIYSADGNYELLVNGVSQGVEQCRESPIVNPPVWQEGTQYVLFEQVSVSAGQDVQLIVRQGLSGYAIISGLQIQGSTASPPPPPCALPDDIVSWWQAESNALDSVGTNDGTLVNGASFATGKVGQAFSFDGVDDSVSFGNTIGNFGSNDFSIEFWLQTTNTTRVQSLLSKRVICTVGSFFDIRIGGASASDAGFVNAAMMQNSSGANVNRVRSTTKVNDGIFHHVALVREGTSAMVYVDGRLEGSNSTPGITFISNSANLVAGRSPCVTSADGTRYFKGQLDELSIYERALSPGEVVSLFNAGSAGKCPPPDAPPASVVTNGSFEEPPGVSTYRVFSVGTGIPGWVVENGTVEVVGPYWQAAEGSQSLDLNGTFENIGTIYQDLPTVPGQAYTLRLAYAGNPDCNPAIVRSADVFWAGVLLTNLSRDVTGYTRPDMGWSYFEQTVIASSATTRLRFKSTSSSFCGLTFDDVSATPTDGPPHPPCALPEGIVNWWQAESNAVDVVGAHDGVLNNGASFAPGKVGQAFSFDGIDDTVSFGNTAGNFGSNDFSIEFWVRTATDTRILQSLLAKRPACGRGNMIEFRIGGVPIERRGLVTVELDHNATGPNRSLLRSTSRVDDGQFHHVALVRQQTNAMVYVDGALEDSNSTPGITFISNAADLVAGRSPCVGIDTTAYFHGNLDELSLYERALTPEEITAIYDAGNSGKCHLPEAPVVPAITLLTPPTGTNSATILIQGTNFSTVAEENIVQFGAVQAVVMAADASSLTTIVPPGATYGPVTVTVNGLTAYSSEFFLPVSAGVGHPITASGFSSGMNMSAADGPVRVIISDLDNDGHPDLAVGNIYDNTISIHPNLGSSAPLSPASFSPRFELATGTGSINPYWIVAADLDGDGRPDLISSDDSNGRVGVRRNESQPGQLSAASFGPLIEYPVGARTRRVVVFDLDGDARPEIITANISGSVSILPNLGPGLEITSNSFGAAVNLPTPTGTSGVAVGDLDGDGFPDLAVAHRGVNYLSVFRNLGITGPVTDASFAPAVTLPVDSETWTVRCADVDGDGNLDLIAGTLFNRKMSVLRNVSTPGSLVPGSFEPHVQFGLVGRAHNIGLGDLNGNGRLDIAMATEISSRISLFENLSTPGSFTNSSLGPQVLLPTGWNAWGVSVGDLDLDGRPDIVFANQYDDTITLYRNQIPTGVAPTIVAQPTGGTVNEGDAVTLTVDAGGTPPLHYHWWKDGGVIASATNAALAFDPVLFGDAGTYAVVVSNAFGSVISSNAVLDVNRLPVADASATLPLVISPNNTNATVVLDGTLSFDPDGDPLTYLWRLTAGPALGTGVVTVTTLPVGSNLVDLVVNDGMASDTNSLVIEVITLAEAADRLLEAVTDSDSGNGQSLIATLRAALASIDRSNPISAINQLQAFQSQVQAQVAPEDPVLAAEFIQQAQDIIDSLAMGELGAKNLKALASHTNRAAQVEFSGSPSAIYIIEASGDMVHWQMIGVARHNGHGKFDFEDPDASRLPCRFYRVVTP